MYGLDINFLKDRPEYNPTPVERRRRGGRSSAPESKQPLYLGLITALVLLGLSGLSWIFLQTQNEQLRTRKTELEAQLGKLNEEEAKLQRITAETRQIQDESTALAGVFDSIKPWSALFSEISSRTPAKVRITEIKDITQTDISQLPESFRPSPSLTPAAGGTASPAPAASPNPLQTGLLQISGTATSVNDVNDFLLNLQQSKLFKPERTKILSSTLGNTRPLKSPTDFKSAGGQGGSTQVTLPAEIEFKIVAGLTEQPASALLPELERNKATGLVTRIETLQQKGVIKR